MILNKQQGFTLIELVVVIIILGILAAMRQLEASIIEGAENTYKMAILQGCHKESKCDVVLGYGQIIEVEYGYPESKGESQGDILDTIEADYEWYDEDTGADFHYCYGSESSRCSTATSSNIRIGYDPEIGGCYVRYIEPAGTGLNGDDIADDTYEVYIETSGC